VHTNNPDVLNLTRRGIRNQAHADNCLGTVCIVGITAKLSVQAYFSAVVYCARTWLIRQLLILFCGNIYVDTVLVKQLSVISCVMVV